MLRPEKLKKLKKGLISEYGLTKIEAQALSKYKGHSAKIINSKIRSGTLHASDIIFCQNLKTGLLKLPLKNLNTIYRNLKFDSLQLKNAKKYFKEKDKLKIRFAEFLSCSLRENFTGSSTYYNWTMEITTLPNSIAKDLMTEWNKYGLNDAEQEVLFPSNACFKVTYLGTISNIKTILKEIPIDMNIDSVPLF